MIYKSWIGLGLGVLAIGGLLLVNPFSSAALGTGSAALTPAMTIAQPAAATAQIAAATENGTTFPQRNTGCGMRGGRLGGAAGAGVAQGTVLETVSKLTGLTGQEISDQRRTGKSFVEIAKAKGVTEDALLAAVKKAYLTLIDERVADGTMTKETADLCTKNFEARIKTNLESTTLGPQSGRGCSGQRGAGRMIQGSFSGLMQGVIGGWCQQAPVQTPTQTPAVQSESI